MATNLSKHAKTLSAFEGIIKSYRSLSTAVELRGHRAKSDTVYFYQKQFSAKDWKVLLELQRVLEDKALNERMAELISMARPVLETLTEMDVS